MMNMETVSRIKPEILDFIKDHKDYPSSSELSERFPYTDETIKAFFELLVNTDIFYDPVDDQWMAGQQIMFEATRVR